MLRALVFFFRHLVHALFRTGDQHRMKQIAIPPQRQRIKRMAQTAKCLFKSGQQSGTATGDIGKGVQRVKPERRF